MIYYKHSDGAAIIRLIPNKFNYSTYVLEQSKTLLNFEYFHLLTIWDDVIINFPLNGTAKCFQKQLSIILQKEFRS